MVIRAPHSYRVGACFWLPEEDDGRVGVKMASYEHPYIPRDLQLPGYVPLSLSPIDIVLPLLGSSAFVVAAIWLLSGGFPKLTKMDRLLMCWWTFSGLSHIIIEGYFVLVPDFFKKKTPFYLDELWKEYSKGDSRYVIGDSTVVALEGFIAAIDGPASLLVVYAIASSKPYSYILQFGICLTQLYGCVIYFVTAYLDGDNFSTTPFFYWAYFIPEISFWVVFPTLIAIRSWKKVISAFELGDKKKKKT